jgi:hypothetical protein
VQYRVELSTRYQVRKNLDAEVQVDFIRPWETIGENMKNSAKNNVGYYDTKRL